jgi:type I restriction enzyme, S subunit
MKNLSQRESISKFKEFRQSIISEAVTGKIDVKDWQPNKKHLT